MEGVEVERVEEDDAEARSEAQHALHVPFEHLAAAALVQALGCGAACAQATVEGAAEGRGAVGSAAAVDAAVAEEDERGRAAAGEGGVGRAR